MGNKFGTDILIQAADQKGAAAFYVKELGFEITDETSNMISIHGPHINFFIERGPKARARTGSHGREHRRG
jgi:hypothetical protein